MYEFSGINATYVWPNFPSDDHYFSVEAEFDDGGTYVTINKYAENYELMVARWCGFGDVWDNTVVPNIPTALGAWTEAYAILGELNNEGMVIEDLPKWAYSTIEGMDEEII